MGRKGFGEQGPYRRRPQAGPRRQGGPMKTGSAVFIALAVLAGCDGAACLGTAAAPGSNGT